MKAHITDITYVIQIEWRQSLALIRELLKEATITR